VSKKKLLGLPLSIVLVFGVILLAMLLVSALGGPIGSKLLQLIGVHFTLPSWMAVETPQPELAAEGLFHLGPIPVTNTLLTTWITIVILLVWGILATRKMKLIPRGIQNVFEYAVSTLLNLCENIAGPKYGRQVFPVVATIFLFVFINAWTSLIPGYGSITAAITHAGETLNVPLLRGANTDINVPLALAIVAFVTAWGFGIKAHGVGFFKQFVQTKKIWVGIKEIFQGKFKSALGNILFGVIELFVGFLELISQFIRLVSFTFRLFGNMTAGEILMLSISFLVPWVLSIAIYGLEMLVGFVQALAFSLLTLIFTSLAVAGHEEEESSQKVTEAH
jgi:F-type H+-transporting ATPase subunit a